MTKRIVLLAALLLLTASRVHGQATALAGPGQIASGPTPPAKCSPDDPDISKKVFFKTTAPIGTKECTSTDTWTPIGSTDASLDASAIVSGIINSARLAASTAIIPTLNVDLGSAGSPWKDFYFSGSLVGSGGGPTFFEMANNASAPANPASGFGRIAVVGNLWQIAVQNAGFFKVPDIDTAAPVVGNCVKWISATRIGDQGTTCGGAGAATAWSSLTNPTVNLSLAMAANTSTFTTGTTPAAIPWVYTATANTGAGIDFFKISDSASNTGTGVLFHVAAANLSAATPFQADFNGAGFKINTSGALVPVGTGALDLTAASATTGFTVPIAAGASPTASGTIAFNSTIPRRLVYGNAGVSVNVVGPTTTDTFANKTIDTASNTIKIAGVTITSTTGNTATLASGTGTFTSGHFVKVADTLGNLGDGGATVSLTADVAGTLPLANGGTNSTTKAGAFDSLSPMTTAGDIIYGGVAGTGTRLGIGAATTVLHGGASAPAYSAVSLTADVTGTLPVANGGTNVTSALDDQVLVSNGTTWQAKSVPDCTDTGGNHLNYTAATNAISCGTTGGGGGTSPPFADNAALVKNSADATKLVILDASLVSASTTRTLKAPNANDTLVGKATTDTLTNKTLVTASAANVVTFVDYQKQAAAATGNGADQLFYSTSLPANTLAAGKCVRVTVLWQHTTGTAAIAYKFKYGVAGALTIAAADAGSGLQNAVVLMCNDPGVTGSQQIMAYTLSVGSAAAPQFGTSAEDSTTTLTLGISFNVANTDQVTGKMYLVELIQ